MSGLIKTLNSKSQYFCIESKCNYLVTIVVSHVDSIHFLPINFPNDTQVSFNRFLFLLEEIEKGEILSYKFLIPIEKVNWWLLKSPMLNEVNVYLNEKVKPEKLEDYKYRTNIVG